MNIKSIQEEEFSIKKMGGFINPIQDGLFRGCSRMGGGGLFGPPPLNPPHISYNDETWHSYTLPKEDAKTA